MARSRRPQQYRELSSPEHSDPSIHVRSTIEVPTVISEWSYILRNAKGEVTDTSPWLHPVYDLFKTGDKLLPNSDMSNPPPLVDSLPSNAAIFGGGAFAVSPQGLFWPAFSTGPCFRVATFRNNKIYPYFLRALSGDMGPEDGNTLLETNAPAFVLNDFFCGPGVGNTVFTTGSSVIAGSFHANNYTRYLQSTLANLLLWPTVYLSRTVETHSATAYEELLKEAPWVEAIIVKSSPSSAHIARIDLSNPLYVSLGIRRHDAGLDPLAGEGGFAVTARFDDLSNIAPTYLHRLFKPGDVEKAIGGEINRHPDGSIDYDSIENQRYSKAALIQGMYPGPETFRRENTFTGVSVSAVVGALDMFFRVWWRRIHKEEKDTRDTTVGMAELPSMGATPLTKISFSAVQRKFFLPFERLMKRTRDRRIYDRFVKNVEQVILEYLATVGLAPNTRGRHSMAHIQHSEGVQELSSATATHYRENAERGTTTPLMRYHMREDVKASLVREDIDKGKKGPKTVKILVPKSLVKFYTAVGYRKLIAAIKSGKIDTDEYDNFVWFMALVFIYCNAQLFSPVGLTQPSGQDPAQLERGSVPSRVYTNLSKLINVYITGLSRPTDTRVSPWVVSRTHKTMLTRAIRVIQVR